METQQIIEDLESFRVTIGRHMLALDNMNPVERNNAVLCDLERMRQIIRKLEKLNR